jgi:hypothetical protein
MKILKKILVFFTITILSVISLFFVYINVVALGVFFSPEKITSDKNKEIYDQYKVIKWKYETELDYLDSYCSIQNMLPKINSTIQASVYYYSNEIEINSTLNPYPESTTIYEIGRVESTTNEDIVTEGGFIRLYRIEMNEDTKTYMEYISHMNEPYLYLVKDNNSSEFLIYPILLGEIGEINNQFYIEL